MEMNLSKLWELVIDREAGILQFMGLQRMGHNWVTELDWTVYKYIRVQSSEIIKSISYNYTIQSLIS